MRVDLSHYRVANLKRRPGGSGVSVYLCDFSSDKMYIHIRDGAIRRVPNKRGKRNKNEIVNATDKGKAEVDVRT